MPEPKYPRVEHARVPVRHRVETDDLWLAECRHCGWTYTHTVGAAAREQADYHRHQHRTGQIEATR